MSSLPLTASVDMDYREAYQLLQKVKQQIEETAILDSMPFTGGSLHVNTSSEHSIRS